MALSEDIRFEDDATAETMPRRRARKPLIPITMRELVEWTYAAQRAGDVPDERFQTPGRTPGRSQTGLVVERMIQFAQLGCQVDVSSNFASIWGETRCHEDALTVHAAVERLPPRQCFLLIEHGQYRSAPDWQPAIFPLRCVPVQGNGGKPRGLYLGSGRKLVGHEIGYEGDWPSRGLAEDFRAAADAHKRLWSDPENWPGVYRRRSGRPVAVEHEWTPEPYRRCADEVLRRARDLYSEWYEGLMALRGLLDAGPATPSLTRFRISALGAVSEPWRT
jgi:hypothetical protein